MVGEETYIAAPTTPRNNAPKVGAKLGALIEWGVVAAISNEQEPTEMLSFEAGRGDDLSRGESELDEYQDAWRCS